jgi:hypothetical protein
MSSNNVGHLITKTITTLQHFAALQHTSPNYTSRHLSTLHFLSFKLHYPLICLKPFTFPTVLSWKSCGINSYIRRIFWVLSYSSHNSCWTAKSWVLCMCSSSRICNCAVLLINEKTVQLGYNDLVFCDTSAIAFHMQWYQIILHKARVFLPRLVRHK